MKKIIFGLLLVLLIGWEVKNSFGQEKQNYFSEAQQINHLLHSREFADAVKRVTSAAPGMTKGSINDLLKREAAAIAQKISVPHYSDSGDYGYNTPNLQNPSSARGGTVQPIDRSQPPASASRSPLLTNVDSSELQSEIRTVLLLGMYNHGANKRTIDTLNNKIDTLNNRIDSLIGLNQPHPTTELFTTLSVASALGQTTPNGSNFGFSEADLIRQITDFAIKRAKEEMVEVYLKKWYEAINRDSIVHPLVPQTLNIFQAFIDDHSVRLATYGEKWKAAFQEDLRNIPVVLQDDQYVGLVLAKAGFKNMSDRREVAMMISGGDELVYNLYLKKHLVTVLEAMAGQYLSDPPPREMPIFSRMVIASSIVLEICGSIEKDNQTYSMVESEDIRKMTSDDLDVLFRLIYVRHQHALEVSLGSEMSEFFRRATIDQTDPFIIHIKETLSILSAYQKLISSSSNSQTKVNLNFEEARQLFSLTFQLLENIAGFDTTGKLHRACELIRPYFQFASELGEGISTQQYGKVLDGLIGMMTLVNDSSGSGDEVKKEFRTTMARVQKTGSFMVNILSAKNSDEVESSLDELIPRGQYQLKNTSAFSVSLSAYPGIIGGTEQIKVYETDLAGAAKTGQPRQPDWKGSVAAYLPIGLDLSFGDARHTKHFGSWNFFVQAIDLGAVLNYRLTSDSAQSTTPYISFRQLFSPGLSLMRHFNNSPLVFGLAFTYTPNLRSVKQQETLYQPSALRIAAFLSVDVTGLIIHSHK